MNSFVFSTHGGSDLGARMGAANAEHSARQAKDELQGLANQVERLMMIAEALWILLKQQHGHTDETLVALLEEIDLRDGKLDGRVSATPPRYCTQCGRVLPKTKPFCIYCGARAESPLFDR